MPDNSLQDPNIDNHDKNYFRGLIKEGLSQVEMARRSGWSRSKISRKFDEWGFKLVWVESDATANAPPAADTNEATAPPTDASKPFPTTAAGDLLTPEIRAKVEAMKKKSRKR
jgi:hypothetical protein